MNVGLHLLEFNGQTLDTTSAMGRFFLTVIGGIAELESGQISERTKVVMKHIKDKNKRFTGEIYGWNCKGDDLTPNWHEQHLIDYMRDLYFGHGCSGYRISKILNELGEKGKLGGIWRSSTVLRTINYEFHKNRDDKKFTKPDWWIDAPFHDTIPWGTTDFLNLYPS
jgi:site-specific DNA recombinase